MTRDQLRRLWIAGESYSEIGFRFGLTKDVISGKVRRYRREEGEDVWPRRPRPIRAKPADKPPTAKRAGASTLPPLASLRE